MRLGIGGKAGPIRAGVSIGRSGAGWGAGAGPISVTGGTRRRRSSSSSSSSTFSDELIALVDATPDHPEDSWGALLPGIGAVLMCICAIWTSVLNTTDSYGNGVFDPPIGYWILAVGSILLTISGFVIKSLDRSYFKANDRFRPTIFGDRVDETEWYRGKYPMLFRGAAAQNGDTRGKTGQVSGNASSRPRPVAGKVASASAIVDWVKSRSPGLEEEEVKLLASAIEVLLETEIGSTSLLQRRLKIGFARAVTVMDTLEKFGFVGPANGAKPRLILLDSSDIDSGYPTPS